ncbi:MAG TPA: UDP-N-acetylmuramate dehydrogenase, partial [Pyrinomonadaceae bacterium]|nr:UDP-N-acetylmuramate dehydrogenase [Pyrinomonadaceae bacterium]
MKSNLKIQEGVPLADLTPLKIGGKARLFVRAESEEQVLEAFNFSDENEIPLFILGGGSNVLISDAGFDGLVLQIGLQGIAAKENIITAQAGEDWDEFVNFCVGQTLAGIECLSGIPGFVGAVPVQNVGAYGQEVSETITKVRVFDRKSKQVLELGNADCKFAYRSSIFNTTDKNRFIVLAVEFNLIADGKPKIDYKDLKEFFAGKRPNLQRAREAVLQIRRAKSMVIDENDVNSRSAGSFFKNPIVEAEKLKDLPENAPNFKVDENL